MRWNFLIAQYKIKFRISELILRETPHILIALCVPYSKSGIVPRSSLLGAGQFGFGEFGKGGTIG